MEGAVVFKGFIAILLKEYLPHGMSSFLNRQLCKALKWSGKYLIRYTVFRCQVVHRFICCAALIHQSRFLLFSQQSIFAG